MAAIKARARRVKAPARARRKTAAPRRSSHRLVWAQLGKGFDSVVGAYESGKNARNALKRLDLSITQIRRMSMPKNLKPNQIHDRITHIRTSFDIRKIEGRINALVVAKRINMKQRGELMERIHTANQLREQVTITLASISPPDVARGTVVPFEPRLLPQPLRRRWPLGLRRLYTRATGKPWPKEGKKTKAA